MWPTTSNSTRVSPMRRIGKATAGDAWQCHNGSWPDPEPRHAQTAARTHVPSSTLSRNVTLGLVASSARAVPQEEQRKDTAALAHHVTHPTIAARRCTRILTMTTRAHGGLLGVQCSATPRDEPCGLPPVAPSQLRGRFRCSSLVGVASPGRSCSCS